MVALAVHTLEAHGPGALGAVLAARLIPAMFAAPLTARLADRHDRGRLASLAAAIEAAAFGAAAAVVLTGAPFGSLLLLVAVGGAAGTGSRPALGALMPALASTPQELTRATAFWSTLDNAGFLLGAGAGGAAVAMIGAGDVIAVAAVLIGVGAAAAASLPAVAVIEPDESPSAQSVLDEALGGLRAVREIPALRAPVVLFTCLLLLEGITDVLMVVLAIRDLGMGNGGPGILYAAWGLAGLVAGAVMLTLLRRRGYGLALSVGVLAHAIGLAVMGLDGVPLALVAMVPAGIGFAVVETSTMALIPRLADDAVLGRVYGLLEIIYSGASGLGALLGPVLVGALGAAGGLAAAGSAYALVGLLTWHRMARLDAGQEDVSRIRDLLRGVPFLAVLPLPRLERLVRQTSTRMARSGDTIVSRGDHGEDFYVLEEGTVEVREYGRRQGPGTSFGEIALLHDVPRTATVRALSDVRMRVLGRPAFLAAVGGHEDARTKAGATAAEHLARAEVS